MSSVHAIYENQQTPSERLFVVLDPHDEEHPALQRAIITAQLRDPLPQLHVFISVDPEAEGIRPEERKNLLFDEHWIRQYIRQPLADKNLTHEIELSWGSPWLESILEAAGSFEPDITLLPVHDTSRRRRLLSDGKWGLLKQSTSPVLLVRPGAKTQRKIILAAVNFQATKSEQRALNERILAQGKRIAKRYGAELHVVNAYLDSLHYPAHGDLINRTGLPWSHIHVEQGYTDEVVSRVAGTIGADIVALGTLNQRGGQGSLRRGNTASRVIEAVTVDTLVVN